LVGIYPVCKCFSRFLSETAPKTFPYDAPVAPKGVKGRKQGTAGVFPAIPGGKKKGRRSDPL
jgi:hypothetical protein